MINILQLVKEPKDFATMVPRKTGSIDFIVKGVVVNKKSGKGYNVEIHMDTQKLEKKSNLKVACSCDDFQYRWAYVLAQKGALLNPKRYVLEPPKKTNPDQNVNACKHIHTFLKVELDKSLKTFSGKKGSL